MHPPAARAGTASRHVADARCDPRAASGRALRHAGARPHRRTHPCRQDGLAGLPVCRALVARSPGGMDRGAGPRRAGDTGVARSHGSGVVGAGREDLDSAAVRWRHEGDLVAAVPLLATHRQASVPVAGSREVPRRLRFPAVALRERRDRPRDRRMVGRVPARFRGRARAHADVPEGDEGTRKRRRRRRGGRRDDAEGGSVEADGEAPAIVGDVPAGADSPQ